MIVINEKVLDRFRRASRCEFCGEMRSTEPAHIIARGLGGGSRLDIALNLVALDRKCHTNSHATGVPSRLDMLGAVVRREGLAPLDAPQLVIDEAALALEDFLHALLRIKT